MLNLVSLIPSLKRSVLLAASSVLFIFPTFSSAGSFEDFFVAIKFNNPRAIEKLLSRGFDPNAIEEARGDTGLILALREGSMRVFMLLLSMPDINIEAKSINGDTALMIAAYKGNASAVKTLLEKGAEPNRSGWTALHYAAAIGNNEIVQMLLDRFAYIDAESPNKTTPIMMAASAGHIMTVKLLLDEGADASLKNEAGLTAIDFARNFDHTDIVEGLIYRLKKAGKL